MSVYANGFVRVAGAVPVLTIAEPTVNAHRTVELVRQAADEGACLVVFPELGLCGYSVDDLFHQDALIDSCREALTEVVAATTGLRPVVCVGLPMIVGDGLYNCAAVIHDGAVLGVVPKSYLPNYREFYEQRFFSAARDAVPTTVTVDGHEVPFGSDLIFEAGDVPGFALHVEICEDGWVAIPPSTWAALAGATVLANLSGSPVTVGKETYRRNLCTGHSARTISAHVYVAAGYGESTTDLAWDGDALITENGSLLARSEQFATRDQIISADIDLDRLRQERMRMISLRDQVGDHSDRLKSLRRITFDFGALTDDDMLRRIVPRFPYVPADSVDRDERCAEVRSIQVQGLAQRLRSTGIEKIVIGVSGGLDSTLALLVAVDTFDRLGLPRSNILGYTMPGFATGDQTLRRSHVLMNSLGVSGKEIDIRPSCEQMLADLDHPYARGEKVYDVTFENVQAGERTSHLFRLANHNGAIVLGTGDLSELALGWCTYGVGDQMSHYNVNGSVPKTLIQHLIRWMITSGHHSDETTDVLTEILGDIISPELVPAGDDGKIQSTEDTVGPYELHDFFLYHITRFGYRPSKVSYLARQAWGDRSRGPWSDLLAEDKRNEYDTATIDHWLGVFLKRFMGNQFKRTAMPNGPKIGSGGSLSPRGDWRSPSDASARVWLDELMRGPSA
ncbi:NAD(+) synthase [Gordonia sp. zg691]|uniref:Glutamine-dependent NAD(+) synthetase n=1 Tax=Gordonia jinghuaiqii TaxID=2758710 RepID=A0A7D7LUD6_9ACTN|nr:NAD(+) synthase [Gordonia jinghuaiqii]MBD0861091.1 NAD(+) synthase [Gordonia jinghuaiqii]MCR5979749.1 NAD(+) synthase [Gordonia jinghuaiqii]QMT00855.1 NAD(+) synthase [Gordonia jinghuaiqii]